jgi:NitT/TauT family transport system permease protein
MTRWIGARQHLLVSMASVAGGIGIWQLLSMYVFDPLFLPSPISVAKAFVDLTRNGTLPADVDASMRRILLGWAIGSAVAIPVGLLVGASTLARSIVDPYIHFFRFVPVIALISLFMAWFGIGEFSKIMLIVYATAFVVVVNTATGVASVPDDKLHAARCLGAGRIRIFCQVTFPATIPQIFIGMRLAMAGAFLVIVAAEIIAANSGIGYLIWNARLYLRTDWIFVGVVTIGGLGFICDRLWRAFGRIALARYLREYARY